MKGAALLQVVNDDTGMVLATEAVLASTFSRRLRGLLGRGELVKGRDGLLLWPCSAVHTFGLGYSLDLLFLNSSGEVLVTVPALPPWRFSPIVRGADYVLELPEGMIGETYTCCGHRLIFTLLSKLA